jgi:hypothetical protein
MMISVNVYVNYISAERLLDVDKPAPQQVQISVNLNLVGIEQKSETVIEAPFVFTVSYLPSIAQISIKGRAHVHGEKNELVQIVEDYKQKKPPPPMVMQAISNTCFVEATIITRSIGIIPPIPLPTTTPPPDQKKTPPPPYSA